ncbi:MAG: ABC transporter ATP-binding protein [Planctomycetes bacterium]|nr:ABC transporter ATP-binding protein [Planctomycetota bacterium]
MSTILDIQALTKIYGDFRAVDDLTLAVASGEIFALLGPNGAGKTTTIRMLMGILAPTSGHARIANLDCFRERAKVMLHVGYLPDEPVFYDYLRGSELLRFVGEMHLLTAGETKLRAQPLIEKFQLDDDLEEFAVNYSKGMKKKLALICALLHAPRVLILDEPTNGLDPFATRALHELVREQASSGVAVFYSTHLLDQAERLCHRVGIVRAGALAALGPIDELRANLSVKGSLEDIFFQVAGKRDSDGIPPSGAAL